ncbi:MAG TPA: hypothetical protein VJK04_04555 [Candidatus Paceibacterota bacterium]
MGFVIMGSGAETLEKELMEQIAKYIMELSEGFPEIVACGWGIDENRREERGIQFMIFLEKDLTESQKQDILRRFSDRFIGFKVIGRPILC